MFTIEQLSNLEERKKKEISIEKEYRTRCGKKVVLSTVNCPRKDFPVFGYILENGDWRSCFWTKEGLPEIIDPRNYNYDRYYGLVEQKTPVDSEAPENTQSLENIRIYPGGSSIIEIFPDGSILFKENKESFGVPISKRNFDILIGYREFLLNIQNKLKTQS